MDLKAQITKLGLWIFIIPILTINICLFISTNYEIFNNTIFSVDQIGRMDPTFPYLDGGASISRTARTFPAYLVFKPGMIFTSYLLILYWSKINLLVNDYNNETSKDNIFKIFGILSAVFLIIHAIFLGVKFNFEFYNIFRRFILLCFIIFELIAQSVLVYNFYKIKNKINQDINKNVLVLKIILVCILLLVTLISIPIVTSSGNANIKHSLWNYFVGVLIFYLLSKFLEDNHVNF